MADPLNPDIVYGGNYGGYLSRLDHKTGRIVRSVYGPTIQWGRSGCFEISFSMELPIFFSLTILRNYTPREMHCSQQKMRQSWEQISPDLTTNDKSKQASSGGPITKDNTSVEYYCTIFTAGESPIEKDLLWTGSDDGLIQVSKDGGKNWENVTPKDAPKWMMWNCVESDPFKKGAAYFVGTRYKVDDYTPYIYKTEDYGKTWKLIVNGIDKMHFTRCLRADQKRPGLLYAGTEFGMYISYDDGASWKPFQLNLPVVPITDLTIKNNDLVVATQGRAFWVIDDLTTIQQLNKDVASKNLMVFPVNDAYRMQGGGFGGFGGTTRNAGNNPPNGTVINYWVKEWNDSAKSSLTIYNSSRDTIKTFTSDSKDNTRKLDVSPGMNQFVWDMLYSEGERIEGMILWNGVPGGIKAAPGEYYAKLKTGKDSMEVPFKILADPNYKISQADYQEQFNFLVKARDKFNEVQKAIKEIRTLRGQINDFTGRAGVDLPKDIKQFADSINKQMTTIEETLYQTKSKSGQDVLNFPIRINDKLSGVFDAANSGMQAPSKQVKEVYNELSVQADAEIANLKGLKKWTFRT